jgi:hypothetical protein
MGLDIRAYSNIKRVENQSITNCESDNLIKIWTDNFPDHCEFEDGYYDETHTTREYHFSAGSYRSYNKFRDILSYLIHGVPASTIWEDEYSYQSKPFVEMLNFSDCEGIIGTLFSEKLYHDFKDNRDRFIRNLRHEVDFTKETEDPLAFETEFSIQVYQFTEDEILEYIEEYDEWLKVYAIAMDNGIVMFQ